jgi:hypothetical protein
MITRLVQDLRDNSLDLGRVLRGRTYEDRTTLPGIGPSGLSLQVKVLLTPE